jgi:hypothetical protein
MDAANRPSQQLINAQKELARRRRMAGIDVPVQNAECGVRDAELTPSAVHHSAFGDQFAVPSSQVSQPRDLATSQLRDSAIPQSAISPFHIPHATSRIRISPTLAAHCLDKNNRHNNAALDGPYRLYEILRALDHNGRGWLAGRDVERTLSKKESACYIYGRRQLKIMLRRGEGLFWRRVKSGGQVRIRLVARAKLAQALDCGRLRGREVELPLSYLLNSGRGRQADVNAALYAAVHAGRLRPDVGPRGAAKPRPISRAKLQELAGCSSYRQRSYERRLNMEVQSNIHILGAHSDYGLQRARHHLRLPAYKHTDYQGKINRHKRGAAYIAVRLPNSYSVPDAISAVSSRRQRTINRSLDGLCHMGSGGSDREAIVRLFHRDGAEAARAFQRDPQAVAFWPMLGKSKTRLWQMFGRSGEAATWRSDKVVANAADSPSRAPSSALRRG